ncbi:hypothetical protein ERICIV_04172 [Paenibacillus larvae subsp. larvae]|uniref:HEPN AbiU2-like domain-containing protein n=1 Tax=Paenibacillus larvae subsp. larvae TaxID=147375 RepID=A0A2L1UJA3_9BACL|nr:hypothetical protein [Paenibacillus larvae]AQT84732.1 hypothetical protein B1222_10555 [Paenibacillus larvae subsp. pulvifaciens]AQZ46727.1 hypothetical protein B5S25_09015 [Paenibacillus larvae subsp. pulvifaciens]AVF28487.1 hypothetical protein ERICIII_04428 [Paenibacillus larvae subsp. larvae]AVF32991.1 hypothetical protein ERICIV_04172 [Paenibacillus larvae subsp. larvae]MBH0342342.1 hypothetical protein [Paenibacillus larvae]
MNGLLSKEEKLRYMEQLFSDATHAKHKVQLYLYQYNKMLDHQEVSNSFPPFFNLTMDALYNDFIIRMAKLFDTHKDSYGTIYKFLNIMEAHVKLFSPKEKLIQEKIKEQRKFLEKNQSLINKIKTWRDKYHAHAGKSYFLEPDREKLGYDAPMLWR